MNPARALFRPMTVLVARPAATRVVAPSAAALCGGLRAKSTQARSAWASKGPIVTYEDVKPLTRQPTDDILLIDVREPDEVALGSIPSSVSLPLSQLREALDSKYNPGDFQKKFAFSKPLPAQNIIFFCRSGRRSASAAEWAGERGYNNVRNYEGSWNDWTKREGANPDNDD